MIRHEKLDFWLKHGLNVLIEGQHGVGKTAMIKACFERNNLVLGETFLYFSAATLDPWVDLVGVPKERTEGLQPEAFNIIRELLNVSQDVALAWIDKNWNLYGAQAQAVVEHVRSTQPRGTTYLDLVRPRQFAYGLVEAVFFDEFNRSHKKTRNAVMELLQFKSINGKPFPNLKVVWAAINPSDEGQFDVEPIDPAQMDRFHVTVAIPYKPSLSWFTTRFGDEIAKGACSWWEELPDEEKEKVSPRRLEYALVMHEARGDIRDVLPASCNVSKLQQMLQSGPAWERAVALFEAQDVASARLFLAHENSYASLIRTIIESERLMEFFLPLLPKEKLAALVSSQDRVCRFVCERRTAHAVFQSVMKDILAANQNKPLVKRIRKMLARPESAPASTAPAPAHFNDTPASSRPWVEQVAELKTWSMTSTGERTRVYQECVTNIPARLTADEALDTLELFDDLVSRSSVTEFTSGLRLLVNMVNHCIGQIATEGNCWPQIVARYGSRLRHLLDKLEDAGLAGKLFMPSTAKEAP